MEALVRLQQVQHAQLVLHAVVLDRVVVVVGRLALPVAAPAPTAAAAVVAPAVLGIRSLVTPRIKTHPFNRRFQICL